MLLDEVIDNLAAVGNHSKEEVREVGGGVESVDILDEFSKAVTVLLYLAVKVDDSDHIECP